MQIIKFQFLRHIEIVVLFILFYSFVFKTLLSCSNNSRSSTEKHFQSCFIWEPIFTTRNGTRNPNFTTRYPKKIFYNYPTRPDTRKLLPDPTRYPKKCYPNIHYYRGFFCGLDGQVSRLKWSRVPTLRNLAGFLLNQQDPVKPIFDTYLLLSHMWRPPVAEI